MSEKPVLWLDSSTFLGLLAGSGEIIRLVQRILPEVYELKMTDMVYAELKNAHSNDPVRISQAEERKHIIRDILKIKPVRTHTKKAWFDKEIPSKNAGDISIEEVFEHGIAGKNDRIGSEDGRLRHGKFGSRTISAFEIVNEILAKGRDDFGPAEYRRLLRVLPKRYTPSKNIDTVNIPNTQIAYHRPEAELVHAGVPVASFVVRNAGSQLFQSKLELAVVKLISALNVGEEASVSLGRNVDKGMDEEVTLTARILPKNETVPLEGQPLHAGNPLQATIDYLLHGKGKPITFKYQGKLIEMRLTGAPLLQKTTDRHAR